MNRKIRHFLEVAALASAIVGAGNVQGQFGGGGGGGGGIGGGGSGSSGGGGPSGAGSGVSGATSSGPSSATPAGPGVSSPVGVNSPVTFPGTTHAPPKTVSTFNPALAALVQGAMPISALVSRPEYVEALKGAMKSGALPANLEGFSYHRISDARLPGLVKEKNSLAEAILTQAADPTPVKVGAARINTLIYQEAFDKGVLDPRLRNLMPEVPPDGTLDMKKYERLRLIIPIDIVIGNLGHPTKGQACLYCVPSPGSPDPGSGSGNGLMIGTGADAEPLAPSGKMDQPMQSGRRPETFDPVGFFDVALIERGDERCSGVVVARGILLTAAHCIPSANPAGSPSTSIVVRIQKEDPKALADCKKMILLQKVYRVPCGVFEKVSVLGFERHTGYIPANADHPATNDIGVVRFEAPPALPLRLAALDFDAAPDDITLPGLGKSNLGGRSPNAIEVGWNRVSDWYDSGKAFKYDSKEPSQSGACEGDSGAPILRGFRTGKVDEDHRVVGLISSGNSSTCDGSYWISATRLGDTEVRKWLCEQPTLHEEESCKRIASARYSLSTLAHSGFRQGASVE